MEIAVRNLLLKLFNIVVINNEEEHVSTVPLINTGVVIVNGSNNPLYQIDKVNAELLYEEKALVEDKWTNTFHKTWAKVAHATDEQLLFEQLIHYMSTYGMESCGLKANPWIPAEEVFDDDCSYKPEVDGFTIIKLVSEAEATSIFSDYCKVVKAIKPGYAAEMALMLYRTNLNPAEIKSNELRSIRYEQLGIVPENGQEFLKYVVYKTTGNTLVIKNKATIDSIKIHAALMDSHKYFEKANLVELSKIFLRNKELFLAFKADPKNRPIINKIRRLAEKYHEPISPYTIQNLVNLAKNNEYEAIGRLIRGCDFRKLINVINYLNNIDSTVKTYTIRNGKGFVSSSKCKLDDCDYVSLRYIVVSEIERRVKGVFDGKTFYIPSYINYPVPTSEKQMIGNIPFGTSVSTRDAGTGFCLAIAWDNYQGERTDIDLHMTGDDGQAFGWNSGYRSDDRHILYSGDMTDATNGAVEAFMFQPKVGDRYLVSANNFTNKDGVPFKFLMTNNGFNGEIKDDCGRAKQCCKVEDALFTPIPFKFKDTNNTSIGILDGNTFYFYGGTFGQGIVPSHELYKVAVASLCDKLENQVSVQGILELAGAKVVRDPEPEAVDLSPAALTEQTLFSLFETF